MKTTNIFRVDKRTNPFAQIDRRIFENTALSWKAKGLLGYLLSRPDDWKVVMQDLVNRSSDGADSVRSALRELERGGYARLEKTRDDDGKLTGNRWVITEEPRAVAPEAEMGEQAEMPVLPISGEPHTVNPYVENPTLSNKESTDKKISPKEDELTLEAGRFVEWFVELLAKTGAPAPRLTPMIRAGWGDAYEKLRRIDGKPKAEIVRVCEWARADNFWRGNFYAPTKLRERKDGISRYDLFLSKLTNTTSNHGTYRQNNGRTFSQNADVDFDAIAARTGSGT